MNTTTSISKRDAVEDLVTAYKIICKEVRASYRLLDRAQTRMKAHISEHGDISKRDGYKHYCTDFSPEGCESVIKEIRRQTWQGIIDKLNVRNVMDSKRRADLDKQLETGDGLPAIETEQILAVIGGMIDNIGDYMTAAVKEAFEIMRNKSDGYKSTGQNWQITGKVVMGFMVEAGWSRKSFRVRYYGSADQLTTIENAFRILDGKGPCHNFRSDIHAAIEQSETGDGSTEYFEFKAHKNGNLHLWFRRMDLVKRMNEVAGGEKVLNKMA